jgi:hypothetical protein
MVSFNYVLIFVPLIQLVILYKINYAIVSKLYKSIFNADDLNSSKKNSESENENVSNNSSFDSNLKQKCFSTFSSPNSYSFTKVMHSSTINPCEHRIAKSEFPSKVRESRQFALKNTLKSNLNPKNQSMYEFSNSIIKPAVFAPSVDSEPDCLHLAKSKLKKNTSMHSSGKAILINNSKKIC